MEPFAYQEVLPVGPDTTPYRLLTRDYVSERNVGGRKVLEISPKALTLIAEEGLREAAFFLRTRHLEQLGKILEDPEASPNDRFVAMELLKNAVISSGGVFPMCQDTGTAIVMGKKGDSVFTGVNDAEYLSQGIYNAYTKDALRYSQLAPLSMYDEINTKTNLPAQIDLSATEGDKYKFTFIAKGGGSANKSYLYTESKRILSPDVLLPFLRDAMLAIGTSACPPYHLAIVIGGFSAEHTLKVVKMASTGDLDNLPVKGNTLGRGFRDLELEAELQKISEEIGIGAQFGGKYFCHDIRVIRLPRHGASCFVGVGVSCSAHRNLRGKITKDGLFLEDPDRDPARFIPDPDFEPGEAVPIDLDRPMADIRSQLAKLKVSTRVMLNGPIIVARDIAHAKLNERLQAGEGLPDYVKDHIIYYAGPAKTPEGFASGSFGPTTAGRMDAYVEPFQKAGGSLVMLAKGNRSKAVTRSCKEHGGFYLGSIGGPAARLGRDCIRKVELIEYPELGMEAIYRIEVENFPAFVIVDDKGNDFFDPFLARVKQRLH